MTRQAVVFSFPSREAFEAEVTRLERERAAEESGIEPPREPIRVVASVGQERPALEQFVRDGHWVREQSPNLIDLNDPPPVVQVQTVEDLSG